MRVRRLRSAGKIITRLRAYAMSTERASAALLARIAKAVLKEFDRDDLYVVPTPNYITLGGIHLELLQQMEEDRLDDPASVALLVDISRIVDCIQSSREKLSTPDHTQGYVSDIFPQLVKNVEFNARPLNEEERKRYEQALNILFEEPPFLKTASYEEFCILRSDIEKKEVAIAEMRQNLRQLTDIEEKDILEKELEALEQLCSEQKDLLQSLDKRYNFLIAEEIVDNAEREIDKVPSSVADALEYIELLKITDPISNATHIACNFFPPNLSEDNWIKLKLTSKDIEQSEETNINSIHHSEELNDDEIDFVELEIQSLICDRPWFWSTLFSNRNWHWRIPSQAVSTGEERNNDQGLLPGYIHGLIFVRNLTVKFRPSAKDKLSSEKLSKMKKNMLMRAVKPFSVSTPRFSISRITDRISTRSHPSPSVRIRHETSDIRRAVERPSELRVRLPVSRPIRLLPNIRIRDFYKSYLNGSIVNEQGKPIYQVELILKGSNGMMRRAVTGRDGTFIFSRLTPGRYRLSAVKSGFKSIGQYIDIPYRNSISIRMSQNVSSNLSIYLAEQHDGNGTQKPFIGNTKIFIQQERKTQIKNMHGISHTSFPLSPGKYTIRVICNEVDRVSPSLMHIELLAGEKERVTFKMYSVPKIHNPDTQVLGFTCCRVPFCPNPENNAG